MANVPPLPMNQLTGSPLQPVQSQPWGVHHGATPTETKKKRTPLWLGLLIGVAVGAVLWLVFAYLESQAKQRKEDAWKDAFGTASAAETAASPPSTDLTDKQVAAILELHVGKFEGTSVVKGPDGIVQEEFAVTSTVRWVEEGKSLEYFYSEQHQQGTQEFIFTKFYDREEQRFVITRRMASDPKPEIFMPHAYETYDAKTRTCHGVVVEDLPPDSTYTWTMQLIGNDRLIDTNEFRSSGKVQITHNTSLGSQIHLFEFMAISDAAAEFPVVR